ncbi:vinorine synthase-like [Durio zibethinus]|uniref:Vinorine synthase-like n=1 Tax=Durio zibethinus TaxID=66656 RepID=A0A6P6BET5_DURZI|nr:vinorine synthase-like [Durio zibethinus]
MKLEVEVISKEIVKPSSPTPDRLCRYQLSFLDQLTPTIYNPLILFYPEICDTEANKIRTSDQLKQSISNALTYFYPLAGRIMENQMFVDCNDEGIPFLEVRVKCQLSDVIKNPVPCELNKLLPFEIEDAKEPPLGIQFNIFDCGGLGIGVCISHKIGDAVSFFSFVNTWAAISRGEKKLVAPEFVSASLFPPRNLSGYTPSIRQTKEQIITKRFVFSASKIEEIRGKYSDNASFENQARPTRVEALSAFIWSRFVAATDIRSRPDTFCSIFHMVNLRTRIDPPQPEYSFGNLYSFTITIPSMDRAGESNFTNVVSQMRDSIKRVNNEYVKKIQNGYNHFDSIKEIAASSAKGDMISFTFTSLCRFPMYEADFGWGKPIWAGSAARDIKNVVAFMDAVAGNGIEAWVSLKEEDMAKFESDEELLGYINAPKCF